MEIHQLNAKQGWQWIISGFHLFRKAPLVWVLACFTMLLIAATLTIIPLLGQFIFTLISPVFLAGIMLGCKELEQGRQFELVHLFAAFKTHAKPLITVGGIYLLGQVLIVGIVMMIGGSMMAEMMLYGKRVDESELMGVMDNILTASLVAILLSIPLLMAAWFSPLLVVFHNMPPVIAMQRSFFSCLRNFIPFQLYGITLIILTILALMPYGLGLIILIPTIFGSIYVSYKDIFLGESPKTEDEKSPDDYKKPTWVNTNEEPMKDDVENVATVKDMKDITEVENATDVKDAADVKKEEVTKTKESTVKKDINLVVCAHCGVELPRADAILNMGKYFCSEEHRQQYQSEK